MRLNLQQQKFKRLNSQDISDWDVSNDLQQQKFKRLNSPIKQLEEYLESTTVEIQKT